MRFIHFINKLQKRLKHLLLALCLLPIKAYRYLISPLLPPSCRFYPSCSEYAQEALKKHGIFFGSWLTIKRLSRCHPWGKSGIDPVPEKKHINE